MIAHEERTRRRRSSRDSAGGSSFLHYAHYVECAGGILLCLLIVATPWLYGTTEDWSVRWMNLGSAVAVAALLPAMGIFRARNGETELPAERRFKWAFLGINAMLLLYCAIAYMNPRATFSILDREFTYMDHVISWLPTTYDRARTGQFLLNALAFFGVFWSLRVWLAGGWRRSARAGENVPGLLGNKRLKALLWILALNGFALAVQGIFQRLSGSSKLLWIRNSWWGNPQSCFGPYSYRGNAADYLNLVWPVTFALWYYLANLTPGARTRGRIISDGPELLLLPMFVITSAAAFVTLSRGAALTATLMLLILFGRMLAGAKSRKRQLTILFGGLVIGAVVLTLSASELGARFRTILSDNLSGRAELYKNSQQIASDFPVFGSGPGTFLSVYQMYRESESQDWQGFLHDDWKETLITFGRVGFGLILAQFVILFAWAWKQRSAWISPMLSYCLALALGGCLLHAKGDFPFQTYSIEFTFVVLAAILVSARVNVTARSEVED